MSVQPVRDFLWQLLSKDCETLTAYSMKDMERLQVRDILRGNSYPPVRITVTMEELLHSAMNQNFIPVVDDLGNFTGIVTRKDIIRYFAEQKGCGGARCLSGRSYKPTGRRRGSAPPPFFLPRFYPIISSREYLRTWPGGPPSRVATPAT